jgi:hypothetical protein
VKIRIGFGLGTRTLTNDASAFGPFVDALERLGFDSLWLSERLTGEAPDPLVALAYAAGRTERAISDSVENADIKEESFVALSGENSPAAAAQTINCRYRQIGFVIRRSAWSDIRRRHTKS